MFRVGGCVETSKSKCNKFQIITYFEEYTSRAAPGVKTLINGRYLLVVRKQTCGNGSVVWLHEGLSLTYQRFAAKPVLA